MRDEIYKQTAQTRATKSEEEQPDFTHDHAIHRIDNIILEFAEYDSEGNETKPAVMGGPAVMLRDKQDPETAPTPTGYEKMTPRPATIVWM